MRLRHAVIAIASLNLVSATAWASTLSMRGYSGLIEIPDAMVTPEGVFDASFNNDMESDPALNRRRIDQSRVYMFSTGAWDRLEIGGMLTGSHADTRSDLGGNFKLNLFRNSWFSIAAGVGDFAGNEFMNSKYGVATVTWKTLQVTGGYGLGSRRLDGAFGGLRWAVLPILDVMADYDAAEFSGGLRLHYVFKNGLELYTVGALSTYERQGDSVSVGVSIPLSSRLQRQRQSPPQTAPAVALPAVSADQKIADAPAQTPLIIASTDTPQNSLREVERAARKSGGDEAVIQEYRYGIPLRQFSTSAGEESGYTHSARWNSLADGLDSYWRAPIRAEIRISPDLRTFIGTEVGMFDYSLAADFAGRLQLPLGLGFYVEKQDPVSHSKDFDDRQTFAYRRHEKTTDRGFQWAVHPVDGLVGLATFGRTTISRLDYDFTHVDVAYMPGSGRHRLRYAYGDYKPVDSLNYAGSKTEIFEYRYWWVSKSLSASIAHGDFFYQDKGTRVELTRYFGDVTLGVFYRQNDADQKFGGFSIGVPLTFGRPKIGPVVVTGAPRWNYSLGTSIDHPGKGNVLTPFVMIEPLPAYNLVRDVLDTDRATPAYASKYDSEGP